MAFSFSLAMPFENVEGGRGPSPPGRRRFSFTNRQSIGGTGSPQQGLRNRPPARGSMMRRFSLMPQLGPPPNMRGQAEQFAADVERMRVVIKKAKRTVLNPARDRWVNWWDNVVGLCTAYVAVIAPVELALRKEITLNVWYFVSLACHGGLVSGISSTPLPSPPLLSDRRRRWSCRVPRRVLFRGPEPSARRCDAPFIILARERLRLCINIYCKIYK